MSNNFVVLDYDGVILNSLYEKFVVGFNAHLRLTGTSSLLDGELLDLDDYEDRMSANPVVFERFEQFVPLIGDLGENAAVFRLIESGTEPVSRAAYVKSIRALGRRYLEECSREVTMLRRRYGRQPGYDKLCPAFPQVVYLIKRNPDRRFSICTTKPLENVKYFNAKFGIDECFRHIAISDDTRTKATLLKEMASCEGCQYNEITFIDDFAGHLLPAAQLGFHCFYAAWGFGGSRDLDEARKANIKVLELDDLSEILSSEGSLSHESRRA